MQYLLRNLHRYIVDYKLAIDYQKLTQNLNLDLILASIVDTHLDLDVHFYWMTLNSEYRYLLTLDLDMVLARS
jgi:hypothetical protein